MTHETRSAQWALLGTGPYSGQVPYYVNQSNFYQLEVPSSVGYLKLHTLLERNLNIVVYVQIHFLICISKPFSINQNTMKCNPATFYGLLQPTHLPILFFIFIPIANSLPDVNL